MKKIVACVFSAFIIFLLLFSLCVDRSYASSNPESRVAKEGNISSDTNEMISRLTEFFESWNMDRQDIMLELCSPDWKWKEENPRVSLFAILDNRKILEVSVLNASGEEGDTVRTVMVSAFIDNNDGQPAEQHLFLIVMEKGEDGLWYTDPTGLGSSVTESEAAQPTAMIVPENGVD